MTTTTKSIRSLKIDGMSGEDCVKKVSGALKGTNGVSTKDVKVGMASIEADQSGSEAACKAIDGVGYKAHEQGQERDAVKGNKPGESKPGEHKLAEHKPGETKPVENKS